MRGLLIAEKPSVMRAIQDVYNHGKYSDQLDFSAFHGHLMTLKAPEEYNVAWGDWKDISYLPMIPSQFQYKPSDRKSVDLLMRKIKDGNYDYLVNACDAGREGEHIFWSFYETMGLTLPVKRFWASSVTKPAIQKALADLKDSALYDGMRQASKLRACFDWLVGINLTRCATHQVGKLTSIGRVQTPTLKLIVDRELEIQNFKPADFFEVKANFEIGGTDVGFVHLIAPEHRETRFLNKDDANRIAGETKQEKTGKITAVEQKQKETDAPTLYSLAELQKDANTYLKFKPDKTLAIAQALYEAGLITYPRTESRFLPTDMIPEIPSHLSPLSAVPELSKYSSDIGETQIQTMLSQRYVDDAGITDHHAIIPTDQTPDWNTLSKDEQAVYELIGKSFLAIFMPPYKTAATTVTVQVKDHWFQAQGKTDIDKGYNVLYTSKKSENTVIPNCKKGDIVPIKKVGVSKGTTKPPARYTPRTILSAMQNAGKELPDSAMRAILKESAGLGTSATRADILDKLEKRDYVQIKSNAYYALPAGISLIASVGDRSFCSPALTAEWETKLQQIENNTYKGSFVAEMSEYIKQETDEVFHSIQSTIGTVVGVCPFCGGQVKETASGFVCENKKKDNPSSCQLWINKNIAGHTVTPDELKTLLSGSATQPISFTYKGKNWTAPLILNKARGVVFQRTELPVVGTCPVCGGKVIQTQNAFICEHNRRDNPNACAFFLPKIIGGTAMTQEDLQALLSGKKTETHTIKTRNGKPWKVRYYLDEERKLQLENMETPTQRETVGNCPICHKPVYAGKNSYYCAGKQDNSCDWSFSAIIKGARLTNADISEMLAGKTTRSLVFTWASGKRGDARLCLDKNGRLRWIFHDKA